MSTSSQVLCLSHLIFKHWEPGHGPHMSAQRTMFSRGWCLDSPFSLLPWTAEQGKANKYFLNHPRAPSCFLLRDRVQALLSICQPAGGSSQVISSGPAQMDSHFLGCRDTQMGRRATKSTFLAQPSRITWDLGIPLEFLPAPHLFPYHLLLLSSLLSLAFNSPFPIFTETPWLLWKPNATKEAEFGRVLRFPAQQILL